MKTLPTDPVARFTITRYCPYQCGIEKVVWIYYEDVDEWYTGHGRVAGWGGGDSLLIDHSVFETFEEAKNKLIRDILGKISSLTADLEAAYKLNESTTPTTAEMASRAAEMAARAIDRIRPKEPKK